MNYRRKRNILRLLACGAVLCKVSEKHFIATPFNGMKRLKAEEAHELLAEAYLSPICFCVDSPAFTWALRADLVGFYKN